MSNASNKEQALKWMRTWAFEMRMAEAAGEWRKVEVCRESVRVWASRAATFK